MWQALTNNKIKTTDPNMKCVCIVNKNIWVLMYASVMPNFIIKKTISIEPCDNFPHEN